MKDVRISRFHGWRVIGMLIILALLTVEYVQEPSITVEPVVTTPAPTFDTTTTTTVTTTTTTTLSMQEIRATNQKEYYAYIEAHYSEFEPYLREGKYTKLWWSIRNEADDLWGVREVYTNNSMKDYVVNALAFVRGSITEPTTEHGKNKASYNTIPAHEVLNDRYGYCDEQAVLLKSMLIYKGIPTQIRIIEGYTIRNTVSTIDENMVQTDELVYENLKRHSILKVFIKYEGKYQWVVIDPTVVGPFGNRKKYHKEEDITETRDVLDSYFIGDTNRW